MSDLKSDTSNNLKSTSKKLYVRYMVSLRCKLIVKSEIEKLDLPYNVSIHGALEFPEGISKNNYELLKNSLRKSGLVLLNESDSMLIDKIINTIIEIVHYMDELPRQSFSEIINDHAVSNGESILKIFSEVKGMSVLQFIVIQKIERAKELMLYSDRPLSEIAEILNYKNEDYLFAQFKKVTGLTPSNFKRIKEKRMDNAEQHSHSTLSDASGT